MWVAGALLLAAVTPAVTSMNAPQDARQSSARSRYLTDDDLLLFSLQLDQLTLTETLNGHGDQQDPLLPVGELARLLDLDLDVSAADERVTGTLGESRRPVVISLREGLITVNGRRINFSQADVGITQTDVY